MAKQLYRILGFLGVQYLLGRRGSFPYGILMKFSLLEIALLVVLTDVIQILVLINLFDVLSNKIPWLSRRRDGKRKRSKQTKPSLWEKLKRHGDWGLLAIAALPYGGGALTGSIVATSMGMDKKKAFCIIITGCVLGTAIFYAFFAGAALIVK